MQPYKVVEITKDEVIPTAERMRANGVILTMIHGYYNQEDVPVVAYEYQTGPGAESYQVKGEMTLPSIAGIYDKAAEWPELEIHEMMGVEFEGLKYKRLFLADTMFDGQGQILVTPMDELIAKARGDAVSETKPERPVVGEAKEAQPDAGSDEGKEVEE